MLKIPHDPKMPKYLMPMPHALGLMLFQFPKVMQEFGINSASGGAVQLAESLGQLSR